MEHVCLQCDIHSRSELLVVVVMESEEKIPYQISVHVKENGNSHSEVNKRPSLLAASGHSHAHGCVLIH